MSTLLIDNYDSFSYNLYQMLGTVDADIAVVRNDMVAADDILGMGIDRIVISPGPGRPEDAGNCVDIVRRCAGKVPILGVCLGHQAICTAYGATVTYAGRTPASEGTITIAAGREVAAKGNMEAKMDDGTRTSDLDNAKVWTVTNNASNSTAWNGNGGFTTWGVAHPYAFYSVKSVELTGEDEIKCYNEINNRNGMISDIAWSLQTLYGKVKDGNKYFSNHPETVPAENSSYANLVDGNDNTYFHSSWSASGTDKHYLRAELPEATKDFYIITKRRTNVNSNRPTSMLVEGSDAAEGTYTAITTLTELPVLENEYYYFSDKISSDAAYQYIRFTAQATNNGNAFFTFSEFYVIESNPETDAYMAQIKAFYHNEAARNPKDENFVNSFDAAKYNAVAQIQEALRLTLAKNAITTLIEENADKHAADPALGQYPTEAYNALKAVADKPDATSAELNEAITTFKFSINAPVFTINGAFNGGYQTTGKSIYYKADDATNPLWWNKTTNKYDKSMLWKFAGSTSTTAEVGQTYTAMNMAENVYFWNVEQLNVTETNPTNTRQQATALRFMLTPTVISYAGIIPSQPVLLPGPLNM